VRIRLQVCAAGRQPTGVVLAAYPGEYMVKNIMQPVTTATR
jgi:hypothetical protein